MKLCGIYKIVNNKTEKFYLGSSENIKKRWKRHCYDLKRGRHHNIKLQRSWNKHGERAFQLEIIEECHKDELFTREQYYLDYLKPYNPEIGYNIGKHAMGGDNISSNPKLDQFKAKQSEIQTKRYSMMSQEEKTRLSESVKGEKNPNFGNRWSDEAKRKLSEKTKGRGKGVPKSEEIKKKYKESWTKERRADKAEKSKGEKNNFFSKKHNKKTKEFLSKLAKSRYENDASFRKKIEPTMYPRRKVEIDGIVFDSVCDAARAYDVVPATILFRIKSKSDRFKGYKYLE